MYTQGLIILSLYSLCRGLIYRPTLETYILKETSEVTVHRTSCNNNLPFLL